MEIPVIKQVNPGFSIVKNIITPLLIGGAVVGGSIAAVRYYNQSQKQNAAEGVLTAIQAGDINAVYDACLDLINVMSPRSIGGYTGIWAGCEGNPGTPVCHDVANGTGCNPATRPFCEGYSTGVIPTIDIPDITGPEFTPANPGDVR